MTNFRAFRIHEVDRKIVARFDQVTLDDLSAGDVVVRVSCSDINYKDALAATGAGRILRKYPLVGGIDLAGEIVSSGDARYAPGQKVLVTGCGLSETHDGGYAEFARVKGDWVIPLPPGLTELDSMKLGTAGFTAALAVHQMERNGQQPANGPVVVTGAAGGVGSLAINMLAGRGYEVVAVSGKRDAEPYLREIGASRVLLRQDIDLGSKPMEKALWAGAVDNLADVLRRTLEGRARVRTHSPLAISEESEPEPDLAIVPPGDYRQCHPTTAFLVVEVASSWVRSSGKP
jgi:NADPH2:quinone reductase